MKKLIFALCFALGLPALVNAQESTPSRNEAFTQVTVSGGQMLTALKSKELSVTEFTEMFHGFAEDFYTQGFITLEQTQTKHTEVNACADAENIVRNSGNPTTAQLQIRDAKCTAAIDFNGLMIATPPCIQAGRLAAGGQCCAGTIYSNATNLMVLGKKVNEACTTHDECASKRCDKDYEDASGQCSQVMTCYASQPLGGACSPTNPFCQNGLCLPTDLGLGGVQCEPLNGACAVSADCCSNKCDTNKCVENYICQDCTQEGQKPAAGKYCCPGFIKDLDGFCIREMPPFILPASSYIKTIINELNLFKSAHAQIPEVPETNGGALNGGQTSQGNVVNDAGLTLPQLNMIESMVRECMAITAQPARKTCLLEAYVRRKELLAQNASSPTPVGKTFTQEEYVQRYNIPAITPNGRSNVEKCEFNTVKDNWIDASNLQRNAELFLRSFEVSYSGKATQDMWHLLNAQGTPHKDNLYTRTRFVMKEVRDNRNFQRDQLKYLDLIMACQCMYTFGPEKFSTDKQTFFYTMCTGQSENKICRDGEMRDNLRLPASPEEPYRNGQEFPNYVEMYQQKLVKMSTQGRLKEGDIDNLDSGAAGINHEEVLVRWLRMRSCNQVDVFMDTEKVETELTSVLDDLKRAKQSNPALKSYWDARLQALASAGAKGADKNVIDHFKNDATKDSYFRGYVHTESKIAEYTKKTLGFLLLLILAIIGAVVAIFTLGVGIAVMAGAIVGMMISGGGGSSGGATVLESLVKDFPNPIVEDRLIKKRTCGFLGLFICQDYYRLLHWPAFSNGPGFIQQANQLFPVHAKLGDSLTCDQMYSKALSFPGAAANPCSGPFKGSMCARTFYRPLADTVIAGKPEFAPWKQIMADKVLMDPVYPEFMTGSVSNDYQWTKSVSDAFKMGCAWANTLGKKGKPRPEDKRKFIPDVDKYFDAQGNFKPEYQFTQARIDAYKAAVKKYAQCKDLRECGATNYDGTHPLPWGHGDVIEDAATADLFANYVYQIHFNWRHMSGVAGIGYPLGYLENYYLSLMYNIRILTTLSIRRGLELDDAYNQYAQDLLIRRSRYQLSTGNYGINMGNNPNTTQLVPSALFASFRALGFPLSANFTGAEGGAGNSNTQNGTLGNGSIGGQSLNSFERNVIGAARRHAGRVATDNSRWKNYLKETKNKGGSDRRQAAASNFFGQVNAPLAAIPSLKNPKDSSSYSGIGGKEEAKATEKTQSYGAVERKDAAGASSSSGSGSSDVRMYQGLGGSGLGGDMAGQAAAADANDLSEAAKLTGLKEGDVSNLLESAQKNRDRLNSNEDDTLFGKVSKAYMRNLDRVLTRKGAPLPPAEKKAAPGIDPEKEEIKKILK